VVKGRLLLVDDEAALLDLLKRYLERIGYSVEAYSRPGAALAAFQSDPASYRLVLTDLTMEEMSGEEMIERMRALNPSLKAIISSGYPYESPTPSTVFLQKPYVPKLLEDLIAKLLAQA